MENKSVKSFKLAWIYKNCTESSKTYNIIIGFKFLYYYKQ